MRISADASGFKLDPVQRALVALGTEADKLTGQFEKFAGGSDAAGRAQQQFGSQLQDLQNSLRDGAIGATEFAIQFERLAEAANKEAAAFQRAAQITEANITPLQRYERTAAELKEQLDAGRISQETYSRAMDKAKVSLNGVGDSATKADKTLASLNSNVSLLTKIEIGRVLIDGFQALSGVFQRVTGQITSLVSNVNSSLDTLNDFSARTGIGVEALQGYSLAAKLAGVDTEQFGVAVQRLGVNIGKANPGDGFDKNLKAIGLSVAELRALAPEQQFSAIGDAISQLPTAADRAAAAVEIFGKQGAALAPLFREGASSIDELRQEADRLGAIVSEVQIGNIADMNDAFDKVFATVQGIVGQVIGNLAPAVTDVANQFLEFVKNFNSDEGGTGIANAITDVLLKGAESLAGVFDYAVAQLNGFSVQFENVSSALSTVGEVFRVASQLLIAGAEGFRTIFNLIQIGIDALLVGLGKVLEGIGSWVSDDLEQFGAGLAAAAQESADRNAREMEAAATNAANAVVGIFDAAPQSAADSGRGSARAFVQNLSEDVKNARLPEVKLETNADKLREQFDTLFNGLVDQSGQAATAMGEFEQAMAAAQADGTITREEVEKIEQLQNAVNTALDKERQKRQESTEAAKQQLEADQKRVEALLKPSDEVSKLEQDLAAVIREQSNAQEQLAAARSSSSREEADAAAARLAQLDQVRAKLEDLQQAGDQGFGEGFGKAFEATAKSLDVVIEKAAEFGAEGAKAAQQLQDGVARAQQQVRDGILSKAAFEAEVANQRKLADERIAQLERERQAQQQAQQEAFQRQVDANTRVNEYLKTLVTDRARLEAEAFEQTNKRKIEAAQNLKAIEDQIAVQQRSVAAAREAGDLKAAKARQAELGALEKLKRAEQNIVDGKVQANQQINAGALASANAQAAQQQQFANAAQKQVGQLQRAANDAIGLTNDAFAKAAERQQKLFNDLNTLGSRTVETADARTAEGAAIVLGLATTAQDPRLIEQRLGNKIMREIAEGLASNLNRIGIPATLL
jgi:hypothetical protein